MLLRTLLLRLYRSLDALKYTCGIAAIVLLVLPEDVTEWVQHTPDAISVRNCCYWVSLLGRPERTELAPASDVIIEVPKANRFDVDWLNETMHDVSKGVKVA